MQFTRRAGLHQVQNTSPAAAIQLTSTDRRQYADGLTSAATLEQREARRIPPPDQGEDRHDDIVRQPRPYRRRHRRGATRLPQPITGYTCCNLRDNGGWIFSDNVQDGKLIPAGEPVTLTSTKRTYYVYGEFAQRSIGLWDTQSDNSGQVFAWVHRIVVSEDPRPKIAALPPEIRDAIHAAKVVRGMTRQQVLWAVGYPGLDETPDLAGPVWRYWTPKAKKTVDIQFGPDGKVVAISGPPASVQLMSVAP